jgi:hypothetical protein
MKTHFTPRFDPASPYAVIRPAWGNVPAEILSTADCVRCVEEDLRHLSRSSLGLEAVELRPVPTKGAHGGWRVAAGDRRPCQRAPQMSIEDWPVDNT